MNKDYWTEKEIEETEEMQSQDVYYADAFLDHDEYGLSGAEAGFLLGYIDA